MEIKTPHIKGNKEDFAETVIMPGDPLRAEHIATNYLKEVKKSNGIRGIYAYTGLYNGKKVTTMASNMGMPSMGIYSYELYKFFGVQKIIRVGSCGAYREDIKILDIILADKAYTESNFAYTFNNSADKVVYPSIELTNKIYEKSKELNLPVHKGTIMTSDCFDWYIENVDDILNRVPKDIQIDGAEMEAFALFYTAKTLGKEAACLATVVDNHYTKEEVSSEVREKSLNKMIELALSVV